MTRRLLRSRPQLRVHRGIFMNHLREAEPPPALLLQAASSREGGCAGLQPHTATPQLLSFLRACPVRNLSPLPLNSGDSAPTRNGRIHTLAEEQAIAFTHLPGAYLTSAKSLGRAALVLLCTGHVEKSVTDHARVHIWEGSAFQSPQHPRSRASGPALKA